MSKGRVPQQLVLSRRNCATILRQVSGVDAPGSHELYTRLMGSWGPRPDRTYITFRPTDTERAVLRQIPLPVDVVSCGYRFVAVYRCDSRPSMEVTLRTYDRPPRKRKFKVAGGTKRFTLVSLKRRKESSRMAKGKTKGKTKAVDPIDELEAELEGLEEVEDEDEELEDEAPEVEDDEDEDEDGTDYESMTNAELKALCKERGIKGVTQANKTKLIAALEEYDVADDEEEDDEEDDEDEDDGPNFDAMDRSELKAYIKEHDADFKAKKSQSDDDLRAVAAALTDEDEDDDEEDDEPEPPKKGKKAPPKKGGKQPGQLVRELPAGKLGANDIAEMAGTKALNVRNFLRNNKEKFPKNEELGRYAFTAKQAQAIVKAMSSSTRTTTVKAGTKTKSKKR